MAAAVATQHKFRWGELEEEEEGGGGDLDFLLPPRVVVGPDASGVMKVIEYRFDDDGRKVKVTTTTRTRRLARARLSRSAVERRAWPKFGDAVREDAGARLTMVSTEEIVLERPRAPGSKTEEPRTDTLRVGSGTGVLMLCRTCGEKGAHWTSQCPYKDLAPQTESSVDRPPSADGPSLQGGASNGAYRPPINREGAERSGNLMRRRNDENSVRVSNLSEDAREPDLLELFGQFGIVTRVYVAVDRRTGASRGFGFVNFLQRVDGEKAISKLNGYGYDNLILRVEWAAPRSS